MKIGLFIPCYIDQFYPQVGIATLQLLEKLNCDVNYPMQQTCCGQPMANSGCEEEAIPTYLHFIETFQQYDYVVAPSGSCVYHIRKHYDVIEQTEQVKDIRNKTLDLVEFLVDVLKIENLEVQFPYKVGLHQSCHGLRGLRLGQSSELVADDFSKIKYLLNLVSDIELTALNQPDECCGFGGTFAVTEEAISVKMGKDRIADHKNNGAQYITAGDMSCLMHMEGILRRNKSPMKVIHIAQILNGFNKL